MITCYLDDSDNTDGPVLTIGGYLSRNENWLALEPALDDFLNKRGIGILHALDLYHNRNAFLGWRRPDKLEFIEELCKFISPFRLAGICSSVRKKDFKENKRSMPGAQNMSPIGYAFGKVITAAMFKIGVVDSEYSLSFVLESGNKNNGNIEKYFYWVRSGPSEISSKLGSITFVAKSDCRAIQLADFMAYFGRKLSEQWDAADYPDYFMVNEFTDIMHRYGPYTYERSHNISSFEEFSTSGKLEVPVTPTGVKRGIFLMPGKKGI